MHVSKVCCVTAPNLCAAVSGQRSAIEGFVMSESESFENLQIPVTITGPCPPNFGFIKKRLRKVISTPDKKDDIVFDGLRLTIYSKESPDFTDIVAVKWKPEPAMASFAFRAFPDLCDKPLRDLDPTSIVSYMANRFGVDVSIAGKKSKFIFKDQWAMATGTPGENLVRFARPQNHAYQAIQFYKGTPQLVTVAIVFCLDMTEYSNWFNSH
jgi:hypothetical protein